MATQAIDPTPNQILDLLIPHEPHELKPNLLEPKVQSHHLNHDLPRSPRLDHDLHDQTTPGETMETVANGSLGLGLRAKGEGEV